VNEANGAKVECEEAVCRVLGAASSTIVEDVYPSLNPIVGLEVVRDALVRNRPYSRGHRLFPRRRTGKRKLEDLDEEVDCSAKHFVV